MFFIAFVYCIEFFIYCVLRALQNVVRSCAISSNIIIVLAAKGKDEDVLLLSNYNDTLHWNLIEGGGGTCL